MQSCFRNKRGTDKPIEIFVALFIILAVAMVILKMFSGQIQDKTKELQNIQQKEKYTQAKGDAKRECDELCTNALQDDCNLQQKAQFCQHKLLNGLDINMNGQTGDYSEDLLSGVGVCEDAIYCPHVTSCQCQGDLSVKNCLTILDTYFKDNMGMQPDAACDMIKNRYQTGKCTIPDASIFWLDTLDPTYQQMCSGKSLIE
jgi:hypothetical protein